MAAVFCEFARFPEALCVVDALHRGEVAANDVLRCLHRPLEGLALCSGAAAAPGSNAATDDALSDLTRRGL